MTRSDVRPQQARENPEPSEAPNPMPWFVLLLTAALLGFGIVYIARASLDEAPELGDGRTLAELRGPAVAPAGAAIDGAAVYAARCAACHQAGGTGLPGAFPPLAGAEWVTGKAETLVSVVLHGIAGPLTVKGTTYNGAMPAFGAQLQDAEIAAVLTHIRGQWGNRAAPIDAPTVAAVREETAGRTEPFKGDAELAAPE
ncbi:c-type cytochrome [Zeimonas arvi]|uniref:C-type cytochrome n=1 Tax=Zeimonas arvi TaxID=2498847 RepID=A0A5C8NQY6_9BURK|nr:c-type cytochrome [Zeimonas arvi]TXL63517.1 c-type cytochrome [Zeimonas arvi]